MNGESADFATGFVDSESEAHELWGWDVIRETLYDLMALVDVGYYEVQGTFTTYEEAQDLLIKSPLCTEEE